MNKSVTFSIRLGIAGVGTVGTSVVNILHDKFALFKQQGIEMIISQVVVRNLHSDRHCDLTGVSMGTDVMALANADDVDVIVLLMGDVDKGLALVKESLRQGKPVITADKALLALHGDELFALSEKQQVPLLFEAAVGGGIPIIKVMRESLVANEIHCVAGIMNGTCNYLLTRMAQGIEYKVALADAQQLGYAEADPSFDVEGIDAAHKLTLLVRLAFGYSINFVDISHEGLADIQPQDFVNAKKMGYLIKPMSIAKKTDQGIEAYVFPALVSRTNLLSHVNEVTNVVQVFTDRLGHINCVGPGAGGEATASAVVADLMEVAQALQKNSVSSITMPPMKEKTHSIKIVDFSETRHAYYLRFYMQDKPGMMKQCASILEHFNISIERLNQNEPRENETMVPVALITDKVQEKTMQQAFREIIDLAQCNQENASLIRVFQL